MPSLSPLKSRSNAAAAAVAPVEENPAISAFLSPKSRIFAGGHARAKTAKQLTPDEVANKIASMLKPGPPFFSKVSNADLLDFISDQSIMNSEGLRQQAKSDKEARDRLNSQATFGLFNMKQGNGQVDGQRQGEDEEDSWNDVGTVWSALDALPAGSRWNRIPGAVAGTTAVSRQNGDNDDDDDDDDGIWSSLTLTCDIDCTEVKLARSVVVPTHELRKAHFFEGNSQALVSRIGAGGRYKWDDLHKGQRHAAAQASPAPQYLSLNAYSSPESSALWKWPSWWPFHKKSKGTVSAPAAPSNGDSPDSTTAPTVPAAPVNDGSSKGKKRVWVPSTTKVSLHASWWGFNIYLPKTVLIGLEGDVDEAEKIANLVNHCLTFILNNIPANLPASLQSVVTVLKAIAPTTGYISTFIGWSWDTIKSFDQGQGVVLSATWILPVALIPRGWDAPVATTPGTETPTTTPSSPLPPADPTAPVAAPVPVPSEPVGTVPSDPTAVAAPAAATPSPVPVRFQSLALPASETLTDPNLSYGDDPLPAPPAVPVAAPGATLPPSDPSTVPLDLGPDPPSASQPQTYPSDPLGRGNAQDPTPPMGDTPAPAGQVPIDAES